MTLAAPCSACTRAFRAHVSFASSSTLARRYASSSSSSAIVQPEPQHIEQDEDNFDNVIGELKRRRKKMADKRGRHGGDFVDFLKVTVRGGKGGAGAAAFLSRRTGETGPPIGGNGGPGGNVYLKTAPNLTTLSTVTKRLIGGQGGNGAGGLKHGRRGEDVIVSVPVGTVVREVLREGEAEKAWRDADALGLDRDARKLRTRERWLVSHPSFEYNEKAIREAETLLRQAGRWTQRTPSFEEVPPLYLDIAEPVTEPILLSRGGVGGLGNPHFLTPVNRHPRLASRGVLPATRTFEFELKLLADVGLVGLPNAGKSTLLRSLTGRRAEVANYAFTTLHPQIGVVRVLHDGTWAAAPDSPVEETEVERAADVAARDRGDYQPLPRAPRARDRRAQEKTRFTVSDNPGLLARASENVGLGHSFLRSIERSLALSYVIDATRPSPAADLKILYAELEAYKEGLADRAALIALNKTDGMEPEHVEETVRALEEAARELHPEQTPVVLVVSAKFGTGMDRLVHLLADAVDAARPAPPVVTRRATVEEVKPTKLEEPVSSEPDLFE